MSSDRLLLLDLDGVVISECSPRNGAPKEVLLLHDRLADTVKSLPIPVAVLTHRSKAEAELILHTSGLQEAKLIKVFSAEDILAEGLSLSGISVLARRGLRKSLILQRIKRLLGISASHVMFVDDVQSNIDDLAKDGLSVGLVAPSAIDLEKQLITTFDFKEVVKELGEWTPGERQVHKNLTPVSHDILDWRLTGVNTQASGDHAFNRLRRLVSKTRKRNQ